MRVVTVGIRKGVRLCNPYLLNETLSFVFAADLLVLEKQQVHIIHLFGYPLTLITSDSPPLSLKTVTRLLQQLVNRSLVIYQDDFFKPDDQIPIDPTTQLANWDCPEALDFQRLAKTIDYVQTHGALPAGYTSNEVSNTHDGSSLVTTIDPWRHRVPSDDVDDEGDAVIWLIVDGFMLLSDPRITDRLDYRFFVTASYATLKRRREERQGYHTLEGYWVDPPGYFDAIVWPEFLKAHRHIPGPHQLQNGDNNAGGGCERLVLIDTDVLTIPQVLDTVVDALWP